VRILIKMIDSFGIEGRRSSFHAMDAIAFGEKQLGQIGAILARHARD